MGYRVHDKVTGRWADEDDSLLSSPAIFNTLTGAQDYKLDLARRREKVGVTFASAYDTYETVTVDSNGRRVR